ncbi:hypothetical protein [Couchioplanes azureus]|uniref:hypothetical protein n=1 Tax=Couchioplanes caeruleus TaxID=56438 RepID=UPI0016714CA9|nr:hypothetical protein [Couchioplanes caeruleus]
MTSLLEERYRRVLRLLPADYRQAWEEDMVASFLQAAHAADPDDPEGVEIGVPSRAEVASVAALALRLRLGGVGAAPRPFAWGEAVRRVALIGLLAHAIGALVGVLFMVWIAGQLPGLMRLPDAEPAGFTDRWLALWSLTGLLWLPAYLSAVHGHRRAARNLAVVAFVPVLISSVVGLVDGVPGFTLTQVYWLLFDAVPVLALAAFGPQSPPVRARPWLVALPVGGAATFAALLAAQPVPGRELLAQALADWPGLWCAALTAAAVVHLVAARPSRRRAPTWPLALALLVPAVLGLRLTTLLDYLGFAVPTADNAALATVGVIQCAVVAGVGALLAGVAARRLRRLPTVAPSTPAPSSSPGGPTATHTPRK